MKFEKIKIKLEKRLNLLESHLNKIERTLSKVSVTGDVMVLARGKKINEKVIDKIYNETRLINLALDQMMEGSYGVCKSCGNPINGEQLEQFPYTVQCSKCENK